MLVNIGSTKLTHLAPRDADRRSASVSQIIAMLRKAGIPLEEIAANPVTVIEPIATKTETGLPIGGCGVDCFNCCAAAAPLSVLPESKTARMTPALLDKTLAVAQGLAREGVHIISRVRLNLYNASNEPDNPECIELRQIASRFFWDTYGFDLGAISSDVAFHVSDAQPLISNLSRLMNVPTLWNNICLSVDEQKPHASKQAYQEHIARWEQVWTELAPALKRELRHANRDRRGGPRVVLNMLVPEKETNYPEKYRLLYPGADPKMHTRALDFDQLEGRLITPFVGKILQVSSEIPGGHKFTKGTAGLEGVTGSLVYLAQNRFAATGRGSAMHGPGAQPKPPARAMLIKIYPAGPHSIRFKVVASTYPYADDEVAVPLPEWANKLNRTEIDLGLLS